MPEAPEVDEVLSTPTLLRSFWDRAETRSEIDQVTHFNLKRVRYSHQLLETDPHLPVLQPVNVGVRGGLTDHAREFPLREVRVLPCSSDRRT